jgi:16S rRNA processing protein RimM
MAAPRYLILGRVLRPHGVRGELRVQPITRFPERMADLETVLIGKDPEADETQLQRFEVESARSANDAWLVRLAGVNDRDTADRFRNLYLLVSLENAVPLEEDEVYLFQVIGLDVVTTDGELLGKVENLIETGANDVYIVKGGAYGEVLIPAIDSVVLNIDTDAGVMTVQIPEGLLPDRKPE